MAQNDIECDVIDEIESDSIQISPKDDETKTSFILTLLSSDDDNSFNETNDEFIDNTMGIHEDKGQSVNEKAEEHIESSSEYSTDDSEEYYESKSSLFREKDPALIQKCIGTTEKWCLKVRIIRMNKCDEFQ